MKWAGFLLNNFISSDIIYFLRDRLIEFRKKNFFLPIRVSGTLKAVEYAGENRFSKY